MPSKAVLVTAITVLSLGCGHESAATQQVRSAASVDLECDASQIEFVEDEPMEKRVRLRFRIDGACIELKGFQTSCSGDESH